MAEEFAVKIFDDDGSVPALPSDIDTDKTKELTSGDISEAIQQKEIKSVLLDVNNNIHSPSYMIDMSSVESVIEESLRALQGLMGGGETAIYIKNGETITLVGFGDTEVLYSVLSGVTKRIFNGSKLFKNNGKGFSPVNEWDVDNVRLNL